MGKKTLVNLRDEMSLEMGDYQHGTATTAIEADNDVIDTGLANVKGGMTPNYFRDWYWLPTSGANSTVRMVDSYNPASRTLVVRGGVLTDDGTTKATYELHKYDPTTKKDAINITARKIGIKRPLTDLSVITGNILPDFNYWSSASTHKFWTTSTGTLARTSPGSGFTRGNRFAMKFTDSGNGDEYVSIHSNVYPRLLDLKGTTISVYVWAYCVDTDDDAEIEIYTVKPTTTGYIEQTLTSTTETELGYYQLIKLETQAINDDLDTFELRLRCVTASKNVYFSDPRIIGRGINDYMLPELFQEGQLSWVRKQTTGAASKPCDDIGFDVGYEDYFGCRTISEDVNGTYYKFLRTPDRLAGSYRLELSGWGKLEDNLSSDTDTMTVDDPYSQRFVLMASKQCYEMLSSKLSSASSDKYEREIARIDYELGKLGNLSQMPPPTQMRVRR